MGKNQVSAKTAGKSKKGQIKAFNVKTNYSSFWMDIGDDTRFSGLNANSENGTNLVKLIKLNNYRKAIVNFVKIVTKKDIPVKWAGSQSFTNGKDITISTDIKDGNFDVSVGLALHEASHVVLSDFKLVEYLNKVRNHFTDPVSWASDTSFTIDPSYSDIREKIANAINQYKKAFIESLGIKDAELKVKYLDALYTTNGSCIEVQKNDGGRNLFETFYGLVNWIEDRRIDNYIFSTSPGYKAYYHKLYDYYFGTKELSKALVSKKDFRSNTFDSYMFHLINCTNRSFNIQALPILKHILELTNLKNISRLKSTSDSVSLAVDILEALMYEIKPNVRFRDDDGNELEAPEKDEDISEEVDNKSEEVDNKSEEVNSSETDDDGEEVESGEEADIKELTSKEYSEVRKAMDKIKSFMDLRDNYTDKKTATKKLANDLASTAEEVLEVVSLANGRHCINYDATAKSTNISTIRDIIHRTSTEGKAIYNEGGDYKNHKGFETFRSKIREENPDVERSLLWSYLGAFSLSYKNDDTCVLKACDEGLELGSLLGKKLQIHNETRERVDTRLLSGKIDGRRLAHAGYGIEEVFKQITIDRFKKANLHITLDASGSMSGEKWRNTVKMTMAIAKACSIIENIEVQVTCRSTSKDSRETPINFRLYDSRKNKLGQLIDLLPRFYTHSMTPEGLCYEGEYNRDLLVRGTDSLDSYILNISDGMPSCNGYSGYEAMDHTAKNVKKIKNELNIKFLSFYMSTAKEMLGSSINAETIKKSTPQEMYELMSAKFTNTDIGRNFRRMYGTDAAFVDANNASQLARVMNNKFLSSKC